MPRFQDPALHTPEKIRAASSLWQLGGGLFLIPVFIFTDFLVLAANSDLRYLRIPVDFLIALLLSVIVSLLAIMAGIGVCRRRWWSWMAWRLAFLVSLPYLSLFWLSIVLEWSSRRSMRYYIFFILVVGCTFLLGMAIIRCNQFARAERRRAVPRSGSSHRQ